MGAKSSGLATRTALLLLVLLHLLPLYPPRDLLAAPTAGAPRSDSSGADSSGADSSVQSAARYGMGDGVRHRTVRVGAYENPPQFFLPTQEERDVRGVAADLVRDLAERYDWELVWVTGTWAQVYAALVAGEVDLMPVIDETPERSEVLDFSRESMLVNWGTLYASRKGTVASLKDLEGKIVATMHKGIISRELRGLLEKEGIRTDFLWTESMDEAVQSVVEGYADAAAVNYAFGEWMEDKSGLAGTPLIFGTFMSRFAAPKGMERPLLNAIDEALVAQRTDPNSALNEALKRWLNIQAESEVPDWLPPVGTTVVLMVLALGGMLASTYGLLRQRTRQRQEAEDRRQVSEDEYERLFQQIKDPLLLSGADGQIKEANEAACELLGYPHEQLVGMDRKLISDPDYLPLMDEINTTILRKGQHSFDWSFLARDGELIPVEMYVQNVTFRGMTVRLTQARDLRARLAAEKEQAFLASLVGNTGDSIIGLDMDGVIQTFNRGAERLYGYDHSEATGRHVHLLIPEDKREEFAGVKEKILASGEAVSFETVRMDKNGKRIPMALTYSPIRDRATGAFSGLSVIGRDLRELRRMQAQAETHRERLELAFAAANDGLWDWTVGQEESLYFSPRYFTMLGYEPDELPMAFDTWTQLLHPEDREWAPRHAVESTEAGKGFAMEVRMRAKDGSYRHILSRGMVVARDAEGTPTRMAGTHMDITHRVKEREELRLAQERYQFAVEGSSDGLWDFDMQNGVLWWSQRLYEMLGLDPLSFGPASESFRSLLHPEDLPRYVAALENHLERREPFRMEFRIKHASEGYRYFLVRGQGHWNEAGEAVRLAGSLQDIHDRHVAEENLAARNRELDRLNQDLKDFAYIASHDLQEPLRKVRAFGDRLMEKERAHLSETGKDYLARMHSAANRMSELISSLLGYSRINSRELAIERTELSEVIAGVLQDLERRLAETGAQVHQEELPAIEADPIQMRQLFQNLIANALKYRHPERVPEVRITCGEARIKGARGYAIAVADNGIGFDPEYAEKIFKPFKRLHERSSYEGTGMGLAICRKIVERHGGAISATATPDEGSVFTVRLPERQPEQGFEREVLAA